VYLPRNFFHCPIPVSSYKYGFSQKTPSIIAEIQELQPI
jgi:hypothetical protein